MLRKMIEKYNRMPEQIKASIWFLICGFLQKGISVITTPIFTRLLSTTEYGQYSVFNSWLSIITVFVSLNLWAGVYVQGLVKYEEWRRQYASAFQGLCLSLCVIWTGIYLVFHEPINRMLSLTTVQVLAMLIMIWTSSVFSFWSVEQRIENKYRKLVILTIIVTIAKPALGIFLVQHAQDKVTARILGLVVVELAAYTGLFFVQMRRGKTFFSAEFWKYALTFNIPLIPHYLAQSALNGADRIMIDRMVGSAEAGVYSLAYSISLIMTIFNTALLQTIEPWIYKKIKAKRIQEISQVAYPAFLLIAGVNILLLAFAPEIVRIFAPPEYADAIWVIPPVTMSVYFMFLYVFFATFEFYYEKTKLISIATMMGAVINIGLNYIFIELFGYYAAGYTTLLCYIIYAAFHYYFMQKICKTYLDNQKPYNVRILLGITIGFVIVGFLFLVTYLNIWVRYITILTFLAVLVVKRGKIIAGIKELLNVKRLG